MATREFRFAEGASDKFWRVEVDGPSHTVVYGRVGSAGQSQTKTFASDEEAAKSAEKLVAEKLKKGYVETGAATTTADVSAPGPRAAAAKRAPAAEEAAPETPAAPTPAAPAPEVREIALDPDDWRWATWRRVPPRERPAPAPFDAATARKRLAKLASATYVWSIDWSKSGVGSSPGREEALFWFAALAAVGEFLSGRTRAKPEELSEMLGGVETPSAIDESDAEAALARQYRAPGQLVAVLAALLSPVAVARVALRVDAERRAASNRGHNELDGVVEGFRAHVLPYLSEAEAGEIRDTLRPEIDPSAWPTLGSYDRPPLAFGFAAVVGMGEELLPVVEAWPDDAYTANPYAAYYQRPYEIVFGLADPALVERHARRLKLRLTTQDHVRAWLAHTELSALDWARDAVAGAGNKDEAAKLAETFLLASGPEVAPHALELTLASKAPRPAREWLEAHPTFAIEGLVPVAAGRGRLADAAADYLRVARRKGGEDAIRAAVDALAPDAAERVRATVLEHEEKSYAAFDDATTPDWLRDALADPALARAKPVGWVAPDDLPPVAVGASALNPAQTAALLSALKAAKPGAVPPLVAAVKAHADPAALDEFVWRLFERWIADGALSKEGWALRAVGLLGGDASVLKLAPLVRAWPGESQHQRAVTGLEALRAIGTDAALMQINGVAQKVPFKALKARAAECMEEIAAERGLTRARLEDRIVPDCGLDERGARALDFGPRSFEFVLGPDMKPLVREPGGKPRPDLPKPNAKDDAELAARAAADWKLLKKQVAEVAKIQATRLERAMVTGRRWSRDEFERLLVAHPLVRHLVRRLVWAAYDAEEGGGEIRATFRVTEDSTYADARDEDFDLAPYAAVGVAHPLALAPEARAAWGELLGDYEIVPPFPQLGRPVHALEPAERDASEITRFASVKVPATALVFTLEKLGWERGIPQDAGVFYEHSKAFPGASVTAVVQYYGVAVGAIDELGDQSVDRCFFVPGVYTPEMYPGHKTRVAPGEVDPVVISEVLADLTLVASKGK